MSENELKTDQLKVVAAIPCFNEERFIGSVVAKTKKYVNKVIVIDDGSTDDSAEIAKATGASIFCHDENRGYGTAVCSALDRGRNLKADILVVLDGDGQHDPKEIPRLIQPIIDDKADIVVGSRFLEKENKSPLYRRIGQRALTAITNVGSGHKLTDSQSGYRAYSAKALKELNLSERGMSVSSEIQFAIKEAGLRVAEIPVDVSYEGKAKRSPVGHGVSVLTRILVLYILKHPLLLFSLPGIICTIFGVIFGFRVLSTYNDAGYVPVGDALAAIMFGLVGLVGILAGLGLQAMRELFRGEASQIRKELSERERD